MAYCLPPSGRLKIIGARYDGRSFYRKGERDAFGIGTIHEPDISVRNFSAERTFSSVHRHRRPNLRQRARLHYLKPDFRGLLFWTVLAAQADVPRGQWPGKFSDTSRPDLRDAAT